MLSNRRFSQLASRLAHSATGWAADTLDYDPEIPVLRDAVRRFRNEIWERLNRIEELSASNDALTSQSTQGDE